MFLEAKQTEALFIFEEEEGEIMEASILSINNSGLVTIEFEEPIAMVDSQLFDNSSLQLFILPSQEVYSTFLSFYFEVSFVNSTHLML